MAVEDPNRPRLFGDNLNRMRARLVANANLGVDPAAPNFLDAEEGSIYQDLEMPAAIEHDEANDSLDLAVRAASPLGAFGELLDDWAESVGTERKDAAFAAGVVTFEGANGTDVDPGARVTTTSPAPGADPVAFAVTVGGTIGGSGSIDLAVAAVLAGTEGNVPAGTITRLASDVPGVTAVSNDDPTGGGAEIEDDEALQVRVIGALAGTIGAGNQDDYRRWFLERPSVGRVVVRVAARGPGTVDVYVSDLAGDPLPAPIVADLQAWIDPAGHHGEGLGFAPVGHDVLVLTPTATTAPVSATVVHELGYTLDGAGGTIPTADAVKAAIMEYVNGLEVGADVILSKVVAAIVSVRGVADATGVQLNGVAANLAIGPTNTATASAGDITLS